MMPVLAGSTGYRSAVAELPRTALPSGGPAGAIVALAAGAPVEAAVRAADEGAVGLVVEPGTVVDAESVARLAAVARSLPVVVVRRRLRGFSEAMAGRAAPSAVTAHAAVAPWDWSGALRDTVGLLRLASGGTPQLAAASVAGGPLVARVDAAGDDGREVPGAIVVSLRASGDSLVRVTRSAPVRVEALFGGVGEAPVVTVTDENGELRRPQPFESAEREALRRAVAAVVGGELPTDVAEWAADESVADELARML